MNQLVGADPTALQDLSDNLHNKANRLLQMQESTSAFVISLAWEGAVAEDFLTVWSFAHGPKFTEAAAFLTEAAETLTRNAAEQQTASAATLGSVNGVSADRAQDVRAQFLSNGVTLGAGEMSLLLKLADPEIIDWLVDHTTLLNVLRTVGSGGSLVVDFLTDVDQHGALPPDERIVHAIGETVMRYAADRGVSQAMQWGGAALVAALTAGTGALLGRAGGWLAGEGLATVISHFDDVFEWTDKGADALTEFYRNVRDNPDPYIRAIPFVGPAIVEAPKVWNLVTNVADNAAELGQDLAETASPPGSGIGSAVEGLIDGTVGLLRDAPSPDRTPVPEVSTPQERNNQ